MKMALVAVVLVAMAVTSVSLQQAPTYEATAQMLVAQKQDQHGGEIEPLPPPGQLQTIILEKIHAIDSHPVAEEAVQRLELEMTPAELLDSLTVEQVEDTSFIALTYADTDPERAQLIVNTVGEVSSEFISERSSTFTASVYEKAALPESPASPHPLRNGLITLVLGWALTGLVVLIHRSS